MKRWRVLWHSPSFFWTDIASFATISIARSGVGPSGAAECSHGWSDVAAQPRIAKPVESVYQKKIAPDGADESLLARTTPRPPHPGRLYLSLRFHGFRERFAFRCTRGYIRWPLRGH